MKTCQILVDPGATLSTSNTPRSLQMGSWENWQKPVKCRNFYKSLLSRISVCDAWWREKNKISCCPFLFKSRPVGYRSLVSQRIEVTFLFVLLGVLRTWLSNPQVKGPNIWPDRNLSLTPFAAGPYQIDASHQENYLRFFFLFLLVVLMNGSESWEDNIFCTYSGMSLKSKEIHSKIAELFTICPS